MLEAFQAKAAPLLLKSYQSRIYVPQSGAGKRDGTAVRAATPAPVRKGIRKVSDDAGGEGSDVVRGV